MVLRQKEFQKAMLYDLKKIEKNRFGKKNYKLFIKRLQIPEGAKIAITGPSGCGKSTAMDILGLSLQPDCGEEFLFKPSALRQPVDILSLWQKGDFTSLTSMRLRNMGYVLQTGELFPYLTVGENLQFSAFLSGQGKRDTEELARYFAERLDILENWNAYPGTLSVGERQRVAIGRALAAKPKVILADEPTAALDPIHAEEVMKIFLENLENFGSTLVLVTHNKHWALSAGLKEAPFWLEKREGNLTVAILDFEQSGASA